MAWGKTAADAKQEAEANEGSVWIRYFKDPETRFRIAPFQAFREDGTEVWGTDAWLSTREHFKNGVGSFPCGRDNGKENCPGCEDPDSRVRQRNRKYYFWALDDQGVPRVFKMGPRLHKRFQARVGRADNGEDSLIERDFTVIKSGTGKETEYEIEPGEKYEIDFADLEFPDIEQALQDEWDAAIAAFSGKAVLNDETDADPEADFPSDGTPKASGGRIQPGGGGAAKTAPAKTAPAKAAAKKAAPAAAKRAEPEPQDAPAPQDAGEPWKEWGDSPEDAVFEEAETPHIKAWLDDRDVEYPARAPRARIIKIAQEAAVPF